MKFQAKCISTQEEDGYIAVGFADDEFETESYVLLQRSVEEGEQGHSVPTGAVYIEKNSQYKSIYDGIETCELQTNKIVIRLNTEGKRELDEDCIEINFSAGAAGMTHLRLSLEKTFAGTGCFIDQTQDKDA